MVDRSDEGFIHSQRDTVELLQVRGVDPIFVFLVGGRICVQIGEVVAVLVFVTGNVDVFRRGQILILIGEQVIKDFNDCLVGNGSNQLHLSFSIR